ncbi:MAG: HNH endonuclease [Rhodospirillales bacterium]|nr:HNH endonuclease [Rhodospirillales bacterium]
MSTNRVGRPPVPLQERFWRKVEMSGRDQCWLWLGAKDLDGYGFVKQKDGAQLRAHRVSYELHHGPIPLNLYVCHTCDNPSCVNPDHLFAGTPKANSDDKARKGRSSRLNGSENPMSKLVAADVRAIRSDRRPKRTIAARYGVSVSHVRDIQKGRRWSHLCAM